MKKNTLLTRMAVAGIAAGLVSFFPAQAGSHGGAKADSTKKNERNSCKAKAGCSGKDGCGAKKDSAVGEKSGAEAEDRAASCRGLNDCKGQGGCAMTEEELQEAADKMGIPREEAGEPHSCKGKNECKGLGGCNM